MAFATSVTAVITSWHLRSTPIRQHQAAGVGMAALIFLPRMSVAATTGRARRTTATSSNKGRSSRRSRSWRDISARSSPITNCKRPYAAALPGQDPVRVRVRAGEEAEASTARRCDAHQRTGAADQCAATRLERVLGVQDLDDLPSSKVKIPAPSARSVAANATVPPAVGRGEEREGLEDVSGLRPPSRSILRNRRRCPGRHPRGRPGTPLSRGSRSRAGPGTRSSHPRCSQR
jgi:hypothetical protein